MNNVMSFVGTSALQLKSLAIEEIEMAEKYELDDLLILEIAPGALGIYQAESICSVLGLHYEPENHWVWEEIDEATGQLSKELNANVPLEGWIWGFGHDEGGGNYGVMIYREEE